MIDSATETAIAGLPSADTDHRPAKRQPKAPKTAPKPSPSRKRPAAKVTKPVPAAVTVAEASVVNAPKAPMEHWEPTVQPGNQPRGPRAQKAAEHKPSDVIMDQRVRYTVPAGFKLELDGSTPSRIVIPLKGGLNLVITGNPVLLGALENDKQTPIVGQLTVKRQPEDPTRVHSMTIVLDKRSFVPKFELIVHNGTRRGKGWSKPLRHCTLSVFEIEDAAEEKQAA